MRQTRLKHELERTVDLTRPFETSPNKHAHIHTAPCRNYVMVLYLFLGVFSSALPLGNTNTLGHGNALKNICYLKTQFLAQQPPFFPFGIFTSRHRAFPETIDLKRACDIRLGALHLILNSRPMVTRWRCPRGDARCLYWVGRSFRVSWHIICLLLFVSQHRERTKYRTKTKELIE